MSGITTAVANTALDAIISTYGTMTVALSSTQPIIDDSNPAGISNVTEPSGGSYARVTLPTSAWATATNRIKATNTDITFPAPTADWADGIGWVVVYAGTQAIHFGDLSETIDVTAYGDQINIPAGTLSLSATL
jgi:hypothetical protein